MSEQVEALTLRVANLEHTVNILIQVLENEIYQPFSSIGLTPTEVNNLYLQEQD